jgi:exocyst complex component 4
MISMTDHS